MDPTEEAKAVDVATATASELLFGSHKKRKKSKSSTKAEAQSGSQPDDTGEPAGQIFDYDFLVDRVYGLIQQSNPDLQVTKRYVIKPPTLARVGTRRVAWTNFAELCNMMQRQQDHVFQFVLTELGTEGSLSGDDQLILKGKFNANNIETLLRKYIVDYVTCSMCRSPRTTLNRDPSTRLYNLNCKMCGANRSVAPIRSGYHAVSRADRRRAKAAL